MIVYVVLAFEWWATVLDSGDFYDGCREQFRGVHGVFQNLEDAIKYIEGFEGIRYDPKEDVYYYHVDAVVNKYDGLTETRMDGYFMIYERDLQ